MLTLFCRILSLPVSWPVSWPMSRRGTARSAAAYIFLFTVLNPVSGVSAPCVLEGGEHAVVTSIVDGDTVSLEDGRQVRLVGIQAPKLALGRAGFEDWPLAEEAKQALSEMVLGRPVGLFYGGLAQDRHGRVLAHLQVGDGQKDWSAGQGWVQRRLVAQGLARVYSFADNRACIDPLLAAEAEARAQMRGLWDLPFYALRDAHEAGLKTRDGHFELVEGRIADAVEKSGRVYFNFGADWRTDFTISMRAAVLRGLIRAHGDKGLLNVADFAGWRVRVRGWIDDYNGALIKLTHAEQLELLEGPGETR